MKLRWTAPALDDLAVLAERAPAQAGAVLQAVEWLAHLRMPGVGRYVDAYEGLYWPVPPQGIAYTIERGAVVIHAIHDARRRREPW